MLTRRHFLGASLAMTAAYAAGSFVPAWAQNAPNLGTPTLPAIGFRRMKVGDVEVISLLDGVARRPLGEEFVKNAPLAEVRALLASQGLPTEYIDVPFNPFLVVAGNRRILMDTGLGEFGGPTTGKLLEQLRAAGFQPSDIDTVLITHFHGDHIGGLRNKAGEFVFAKAKVLVPAPYVVMMAIIHARRTAGPNWFEAACLAALLWPTSTVLVDFLYARVTYDEEPAVFLDRFAFWWGAPYLLLVLLLCAAPLIAGKVFARRR